MCKICRSRKILKNEYLVAKIGFDTVENEPLKVWEKLFNIIQSCPYLQAKLDAIAAGALARRQAADEMHKKDADDKDKGVTVDPNSLRAKMDEAARAEADSSGGAMKDSSRAAVETAQKVKE